MVEVTLDGKVAVITGGSRGIGLAIAKRFVEAGARVMITARNGADLKEAAATLPGEAAWFAAHAGHADQARACLNAAVERFGSVDILVNNAGTSPYFGPLLGIDQPRAAKTLQLNQTAVLVWTQIAVEVSMAERGGNIINIASIGGLTVEPNIGWYNVSKAAVIHLTQQLAGELGPSVRVNAVAPGLVRTNLARKLWEDAEDAVAARLPMRRIGEPDDVAKAALFLASDAASWITGHTLVVDGGALVTPGGGVSP